METAIFLTIFSSSLFFVNLIVEPDC